jgi:predicted 3-demethylubiquinone-9 3-methyltransferase (glyoxalase superfamily)
MSKIAPCLWFDGEAEEAANFYVSVVPNSRIDRVQRNVTDTPAGRAGTVLAVSFTLAGQRFLALNGGTRFEYTPAISFQVDCADQAEVDRLWAAFSEGGSTDRCGWVRDRYGVSWQIVPTVLPMLLGDADQAKARRVMQAMLQMGKLDVAALEAAHAGSPRDIAAAGEPP